MSDDLLRLIQGSNIQTEIESKQTTDSRVSTERTAGDASNLTDHLEVFQDANLFQVLQTETTSPVGTVNADVINAIKDELKKDPPDWQNIFKLLQNLSLPDRIATMKELGNEGILTRIIDTMPPEVHERFGKFLAELVKAEGSRCDPALPDLLQQIFDGMKNAPQDFADTVRTMCEIAPPVHHFQQADALIGILNKDQSSAYRLCDLLMMKDLSKHNSIPNKHPGPYSQLNYDQMIHTTFMDYVNGTTPMAAPGITKAFEYSPQWAKDEFDSLHSQMSSFVSKLLESGEPIGEALGPFLADAAPASVVTNALQTFLQALSDSKSPMADDIVRDMIASFEKSGGNVNQLPPALLNEIKSILQNGDDTKLDQQLLHNIK